VLRLVDLQKVGDGEHRSGWPYCLEALSPLLDADAEVLLDDFVERTFLYDAHWHEGFYHRTPWIGFLHHPPAMPDWYFQKLHLSRLDNDQRWLKSLPQLRLLLCFSEEQAAWCRQKWPQVPAVAVRHPTGLPLARWSPDRFRRNSVRQILQVGWFLRNVAAIEHAKTPAWLQKTHLVSNSYWASHAQDLCRDYYGKGAGRRESVGKVNTLHFVPDTEYDLLLSENVVLMEVLAAVANNTVVECIARETPICINRQPGPEYYLGKDYPLFYEEFGQIPDLLTEKRILQAHEYLRGLDTWWIRGSMFREAVEDACLTYLPELRRSETPEYSYARL